MTAEILKREWQAKAHRDAATALLNAWIDQWGEDPKMSRIDWKFIQTRLDIAWTRLDERQDTLRWVRNTAEFNEQAPSDYKRMANSWFTYYYLLQALETGDEFAKEMADYHTRKTA